MYCGAVPQVRVKDFRPTRGSGKECENEMNKGKGTYRAGEKCAQKSVRRLVRRKETYSSI
jgi:hypothetical protein